VQQNKKRLFKNSTDSLLVKQAIVELRNLGFKPIKKVVGEFGNSYVYEQKNLFVTILESHKYGLTGIVSSFRFSGILADWVKLHNSFPDDLAEFRDAFPSLYEEFPGAGRRPYFVVNHSLLPYSWIKTFITVCNCFMSQQFLLPNDEVVYWDKALDQFVPIKMINCQNANDITLHADPHISFD
jgi:hypothetical protein